MSHLQSDVVACVYHSYHNPFCYEGACRSSVAARSKDLLRVLMIYADLLLTGRELET